MNSRGSTCSSLIVVVDLLLAILVPAVAAHSAPDCRADYPIDTQSVNYEQAFASEGILPDQIVVNGSTIHAGVTATEISSILRTPPTLQENWTQRADAEQCNYLVTLLHDHPNSMYLYRLEAIRLRRLAGFFRSVEWQVGSVGQIRAYFHKPDEGGKEAAYLLEMSLLPQPKQRIHRLPGEAYVLQRDGAPTVVWNIDRDIVTIRSTASAGAR